MANHFSILALRTLEQLQNRKSHSCSLDFVLWQHIILQLVLQSFCFSVILFNVLLREQGAGTFGSFFFHAVHVINKLPTSKSDSLYFTNRISQARALALPFLVCVWQWQPQAYTEILGNRHTETVAQQRSQLPIDLSTSFLVMVPLWRLKVFRFSEFPCKF